MRASVLAWRGRNSGMARRLASTSFSSQRKGGRMAIPGFTRRITNSHSVSGDHGMFWRYLGDHDRKGAQREV